MPTARSIRPRLTLRLLARLTAAAAVLALFAEARGALWILPASLAAIFVWPIVRDAMLMRYGRVAPGRIAETLRRGMIGRIHFEFRETVDPLGELQSRRVVVSSSALERASVGDRLSVYYSLWEPRLCCADRFAHFRVMEDR